MNCKSIAQLRALMRVVNKKNVIIESDRGAETKVDLVRGPCTKDKNSARGGEKELVQLLDEDLDLVKELPDDRFIIRR